jgi:ABC-2 type transport system ATP-binding protein
VAGSQNIISVTDFQMRFGDRVVIKNLSFEVKRGEVFGFLGSNGSGKTTTLRVLLGIYQPARGSLLINGRPFSPGMSSFLGYLPEERGLYKKESVLDTMVYFGRLKNLTAAEAREWSLQYLERVELADKAHERLDKLSGGQQQKVQLGVTIMNRPELLILDEPTKGFDPVNRRLMMDIIEERRREGATIILVTHQMEEVERVCDRIMLLKDGERRLYGSVDDIKRQYSTNQIELRFSGQLRPVAGCYEIVRQEQDWAILAPAADASPQAVLKALVGQPKLTVTQFEVKQATLDDIFVSIYRHDEERSHA